MSPPHTPKSIDGVIDYAVAHATDFQQFMLYTPNPGTPLHAEHRAAGTLHSDDVCSGADAHGQSRFKHVHPHIPVGAETEMLERAFCRDFDVNGPGIHRQMRTTLQGWQRYKDHPSRRIRERFAREAKTLSSSYAGGIWAAQRWFRARGNAGVERLMGELLADVCAEFGWKAKLAAPVLGRLVEPAVRRQERRLAHGWTYVPPTFYETTPRSVACSPRPPQPAERKLVTAC